jgi:hypothetical protein
MQFVRDVFGNDLQGEKSNAYAARSHIVMEVFFDERIVCLLKKRYLDECSLREAGKTVLKMKNSNTLSETPCSGITRSRAMTIINKALANLRKPKYYLLWEGRITLEEWKYNDLHAKFKNLPPVKRGHI